MVCMCDGRGLPIGRGRRERREAGAEAVYAAVGRRIGALNSEGRKHSTEKSMTLPSS